MASLQLDKVALTRLPSLDPAIEPDMLADTLCDGELLAVALERWVIADFVVVEGVLFNRTSGPVPSAERVKAAVAKYGVVAADVGLAQRYDFEIWNDPACPKSVLKYLMRALTSLREAQAQREFPERDGRITMEWRPDEGFGAWALVQRSAALAG